MNVVVVEQGAYSDRRVVGVFSSREIAEDYVQTRGGNADHDFDITEWTLDSEL